MDFQTIKKVCIWIVGLFLLIAISFAWIAGDQLKYYSETTEMVSAAAPLTELVQGSEIKQSFEAKGNQLQGLSLLFCTYDRSNSSRLQIQLLDESKTLLFQKEVDTAELSNNKVWSYSFESPLTVSPGSLCELVIRSLDGTPGNAVSIWYGNTIHTGRVSVPLNIPAEKKATLNGAPIDGLLCYSLTHRDTLWLGQVYWILVSFAFFALLGYCFHLVSRTKKGSPTLVSKLIHLFQRYNFLIRQLISRDFKSKYKRSVLGVFWSFLNPLLTMSVQYIVFSTIFKSDIVNFPLYLLTGIVCFNFFSEACSMSLLSIVSNASLITKVYLPKYIYPLTRVLSSSVNLLLSMVPLLVVALLTGVSFRPAILLLPFGLLCLIAFTLGMAMLLSTMMVFFRDTQFLWGVVSMLWMYATPVFYPETIIPQQLLGLYKCNPLYHFIRFLRTVLINGVSPEPKAYLLCLIASFVPLLLGIVVFKKNQDKFIFYL